MKFSKGSAYALHALMYMTRHQTQLPISTQMIAKAENIPPGYLAKLFQKLAKGGLVKAIQSPLRGYIFSKDPEEITLRALFEITEGKPLFGDCFLKHCDCGGKQTTCTLFKHWHEVTQKMLEVLENTTLSNVTWPHPEHRFDELTKLSLVTD